MAIELRDAGFVYMRGTPYERRALQHINVTIEEGSFTAIAGHTGSGKSTLVQMIAGLIHPTEGDILIDGISLGDRSRRGKEAAGKARRKVGMVFQYPEHQLFEETVEADIAFGPRNLELEEPEIRSRVRTAMELTGLDYEQWKDEDPFRLSGGQKRRAAIAGVLAMQPKYLVLDEPTAGLDPEGREKILREIQTLHQSGRVTILLISHNMEDIARFADRILVLHQGQCLLEDTPEEAFRQQEILAEAGLNPPRITMLLERLRREGLKVPVRSIRLEDGVHEIEAALKGIK